ncbi:protoporphyrinogen/coproporphyrinogen oxidase [Promicromonospora sukumoe]|uniref:Glycine/D-amino acid oxidase-like deaminating enzyme n=1 Tax=Promicromonospora sukumoe TaxID=88382 RepID=A0A7W3J907_9MICO|nr:NAD(P)/FAD-dependent oxidoreductase [Promicromonospora sukumoe]MBA8808399.1 glycine/D-amino acid oxidase-like deaminating enzyme [Promicromonospora sukumoe]
MTDHDVVIVGAGLAGLVAALDLTRAGLDVRLLERDEQPGGRVATERVDGFVVDRGFQVLNTSYPQVRRRLDLDALDLRLFTSGALVRRDGRLHRLVDPRRHPGGLVGTLGSGLLPWRDKLAVAAYAARAGYQPVGRLLAEPETTAAQALRRRGIGDAGVERFLRPFLSGVLGEDELETSSRYVDLVWRSFARGRVGVPAAGMSAIPRQLPDGVLRCGVDVQAVDGGEVRHADGRLGARAVVVATDPRTAGRLLPTLAVPPMRALTTVYHAAPEPPGTEPILLLEGDDDRMVANSVVLSNAAPGYSGDGRALVATSLVGGAAAGVDEAAVRRRLARLYGVPTDGWAHVRTVSVPDALPGAQPPLGDLRRPVDLGDGLFVAGDHRDTPSVQGAMASGTRAARAVLDALAATSAAAR